MKKYLFGTLAGGLTLFALGFVIYVLLIPDPAFAKGAGADAARLEAFNFPYIILAELLFGFLLTYILHRWATISTPVTGAKAGALVGFVLVLAFDLILLGTTSIITLQGALYEAVTWAVRWAGAGAVIGMVLGKVKD